MIKLTHLCLAANMALVVCAGHSIGAGMTGEPGPSFAAICADREVQVITLLEDHARVLDVSSDALSEAAFARMEAQAACYEGRVVDAVAIYDGIVARLGGVLLRAGR